MKVSVKWMIAAIVLCILAGGGVYYSSYGQNRDSRSLQDHTADTQSASASESRAHATGTPGETATGVVSADTRIASASESPANPSGTSAEVATGGASSDGESRETMDVRGIFESYLQEEYGQSRELRSLLNMRIEPLADPPAEIRLVLKYERDREYRVKRYVAACEEDGMLKADGHQLTVNIGDQVGRVDDIDEEKGLTTVRYKESGTTLVWAMGDLPTPMAREAGMRATEYTYARDGTPVRAVINGKVFDSSMEPRPVPFLTYPEEAVRPGTKWRCDAPANKNNYIEAEAKRFVDVGGIPCLEIKYTMQMAEGGVTAYSRGAYYVDYSGVCVREDSINEYVVPSPDGGEATRSCMRIIQQMVEAEDKP